MTIKVAAKIYSLLLLVISLAIALFLAEVTLRMLAPENFYVWPPNFEQSFLPSPEIMPGISGESRFVVNDAGIRGQPFSDADRYRILTVGGSTTECLYLDQGETWSSLVQEMLNAKITGSAVWIGNVGRSGRNSRHHVLQIEQLLDQYESIDMVIVLVGVNDAMMPLRDLETYSPLQSSLDVYDAETVDQAFFIHPNSSPQDATYPFYKRTEIWRMARKAKNRLFEQPRVRDEEIIVQDDAGKIYITLRQKRQTAIQIRDDLPDLSVALREYVRNLNAAVDAALEKEVQLIFMTQPSMWQREMPQELAELLWFGGIGQFDEESDRKYYSTGALEEAMRLFNDALLDVCTERGLQCLDLASSLPKDTSVFYDDVHFNESGARKVAQVLTDFLDKSKLLDLE